MVELISLKFTNLISNIHSGLDTTGVEVSLFTKNYMKGGFLYDKNPTGVL